MYKGKTPTEVRDEHLEMLQPVLGECIDELKELDYVAQIWVRPERTYTHIRINTYGRDVDESEKIYDIEKSYMLRSDCIFDFRVSYRTEENLESNWRYKVFYDELSEDSRGNHV